MKLRLALLTALLPLIAHAEEADKQSIYQVSSTDPMALTSTSVRTPLLPNTTRVLRIAATTDAHCRPGGSTVVATVSDTLFPAKTPEYLKIQPSDGNYVACIRDSTDGKVWVDPAKQ